MSTEATLLVATRIPPMWAIWTRTNGQAALQLCGDDPRQSMTWKIHWEPRVVGSPILLRDNERGLSIDDIARLHPLPEGA